ncbi:MAG: biosynthetic-type acetolactate synthase large subunit [Verrucomicrobia bacterium]|nr:biosynthetic-type acetolactate synthase large subunit [Verrucomicrobiota bacterium]MBU1735897.1 biosynthetic-type acetolactate synthase large subunit [Verrucomicrobiota bacterium]MBU1857132.1 biosynthetic-type acetolactate synthase large subunit [Verrucomicrobiota bacterium]
MDGGHAIVKTLIKHGVTHTFGYPGGGIVPVFDALFDHKAYIQNILMRHEQGAAHAADGFSRASGRPGVCIVTSGPGAANLVTGMLTAWMDSSPMIAMAGQVSFKLIGHEAFQEADMVDIALHTCKRDVQINSPNEVFKVFNEAFRLTTEGRPGPVYIDLPKEVMTDKLTEEIPEKVPVSAPAFEGQRDKLSDIAKLIKGSERPLVLIGGGIIASGASGELARFVDMTRIPVVRSLMAKSALPDKHPVSLGMTGLYGSKTANYAVNRTDLIIAIGCRFSNRTVTSREAFGPKAKIVHIEVDPKEIGQNIKPDIAVVGDAKLVLAELIAAVEEAEAKNDNMEWLGKLKELKEVEFGEDISADIEPISHKRVFHDLRRFIKDEDIVVTGVGNHQMLAQHYLDRKYPRTFITSGGEGTMGFGLPASIGAKLARPDVEVFNIDGDGSFQMTLQELAVLAYENLKVISVIFKNEYLGMVRQWQGQVYGTDRYSSVHLGPMPDFAKIAEAYGLNGFKATKPSEIASCLEQAVASPKSSVIEIALQKEEDYLPTSPKISEKDFAK